MARKAGPSQGVGRRGKRQAKLGDPEDHATFPRSRVAAAGALVGCGVWSTGAVEGLFDNPAILVESSRQFLVSKLRIIKMATLEGGWED